jgi:transcriptional regulator with XRE-family HTH domain
VSTTGLRPHLRALREARGWTQADVAERLIQLAWSRYREQIGVNANMVAKWERGAKGISARYRRLLAELFRVTVDQLGLGDIESASAPAAPDTLAAVADAAAELLNQLGTPDRRIRPQLLAALTDDALSRRCMLALLDPGTRTEPPTSEASVAELDSLADGYEAAFPTVDPATLLTATAAHVQMVTDALATDLPPARRQQLLRNRARVAIVTGRLAEDTDNVMVARAYYAQATDDASELADRNLIALVVGNAAQLAIKNGQPAAALAHLATAAPAADPSVRSWLAALEATARAA